MDHIDFKILNVIYKYFETFNKYPKAFEVSNYFDKSCNSQQFIRNRLNKLVKRKILIKLDDKSFKLNVSDKYIK